MQRLGNTLSRQGTWKQAAELEMQNLDRKIEILGRSHPDALSGISSLAMISQISPRETKSQ